MHDAATLERNIDDIPYDLEYLNCLYNRMTSGFYHILNEQGELVRFYPRPAQLKLLDAICIEEPHRFHVILKARQLGFSTLLALIEFDTAIFHPNTKCGLVAQDKDTAEAIMNGIIEAAYANLPEEMQQLLGGSLEDLARGSNSQTIKNQSTIKFLNRSQIVVSTGFRGGTLQMLHVSEFGKTSAAHPKKAAEIVSGSFATIHDGSWLFLESTAEGVMFQDLYENAEEQYVLHQQRDEPLPPTYFKPWFFPWWQNPKYSDKSPVRLTEKSIAYFKTLRDTNGINLTHGQMSWWQNTLIGKYSGDLSMMYREMPSTPKEAFENISKTAVYKEELTDARNDNRIGFFPYNPTYGTVFVFSDLGLNDLTGLLFMQQNPNNGYWQAFKYTEDRGKRIDHYIDLLREFKRDHPATQLVIVLPHDGSNDHIAATNGTVEEQVRAAALGGVIVLPVTDNKARDVRHSRTFMYSIKFDEAGTSRLRTHLGAFEWHVNDKGAVTDKLVHNDASHAADSYRYAWQGITGHYIAEFIYGGYDPALDPQSDDYRGASAPVAGY